MTTERDEVDDIYSLRMIGSLHLPLLSLPYLAASCSSHASCVLQNGSIEALLSPSSEILYAHVTLTIRDTLEPPASEATDVGHVSFGSLWASRKMLLRQEENSGWVRRVRDVTK